MHGLGRARLTDSTGAHILVKITSVSQIRALTQLQTKDKYIAVLLLLPEIL